MYLNENVKITYFFLIKNNINDDTLNYSLDEFEYTLIKINL